ncbi:hypothetical protein B0T25DRAFT_16195 [Lasiosphaeria hispida]|uniref:Uncharacterized protein n=1 Tax=Lasiosphaeria hispida TaxID=260671 RepID=A0AAJ0MJG6_9PEZI|nr:hypothetical protein B0T25DRAFT_16195 [Lasiosphaeria hispida]
MSTPWGNSPFLGGSIKAFGPWDGCRGRSTTQGSCRVTDKRIKGLEWTGKRRGEKAVLAWERPSKLRQVEVVSTPRMTAQPSTWSDFATLAPVRRLSPLARPWPRFHRRAYLIPECWTRGNKIHPCSQRAPSPLSPLLAEAKQMSPQTRGLLVDNQTPSQHPSLLPQIMCEMIVALLWGFHCTRQGQSSIQRHGHKAAPNKA